MIRGGYWGWESVEERSADGSISSAQRARFAEPAMPMGGEGARMLSSVYWPEVERTTWGLVRARASAEGVVLRLAMGGPALLRFGPAAVSTGAPPAVTCTHPIAGGLLARRPGRSIRFEQRAQDGSMLVVSAISGFHPALAARPGAPAWTGELYKRVQSRLHIAGRPATCDGVPALGLHPHPADRSGRHRDLPRVDLRARHCP